MCDICKVIDDPNDGIPPTVKVMAMMQSAKVAHDRNICTGGLALAFQRGEDIKPVFTPCPICTGKMSLEEITALLSDLPAGMLPATVLGRINESGSVEMLDQKDAHGREVTTERVEEILKAMNLEKLGYASVKVQGLKPNPKSPTGEGITDEDFFAVSGIEPFDLEAALREVK